MLDGLSLWIYNELITLAWVLTMHCLDKADPEWTLRDISEYISCIIISGHLGSQVPLDQWSQEAAFQLIANPILCLSWEGKENDGFLCSISERNLSRERNQLTKGNKQHYLFTKCLSEISKSTLPMKTCSLFQEVKSKTGSKSAHDYTRAKARYSMGMLSGAALQCFI